MSEAAAPADVPAPEELARANVYGLIARLFQAAPDQQLLSELLHAPQNDEGAAATASGRELEAAWRALIAACRDAFPVRLENEHTDLFASPGRAEVTPYLMHYVMRYESETPLVGLRAQLARWSLGRRPGASEPEDHVAALCEVMRIAIAMQQRPVEEQREFFQAYLYAGAVAFCDAVTASPKSNFYRYVARFARAFLELENEAFEVF
ncbi:MAG TPA: molecular chaperone TorD family protein [Burkholderiales bacterium]|nr:molecular chaperone TorD family protein [Burkholderiales bacterium]